LGKTQGDAMRYSIAMVPAWSPVPEASLHDPSDELSDELVDEEDDDDDEVRAASLA